MYSTRTFWICCVIRRFIVYFRIGLASGLMSMFHTMMYGSFYVLVQFSLFPEKVYLNPCYRRIGSIYFIHRQTWFDSNRSVGVTAEFKFNFALDQIPYMVTIDMRLCIDQLPLKIHDEMTFHAFVSAQYVPWSASHRMYKIVRISKRDIQRSNSLSNAIQFDCQVMSSHDTNLMTARRMR